MLHKYYIFIFVGLGIAEYLEYYRKENIVLGICLVMKLINVNKYCHLS